MAFLISWAYNMNLTMLERPCSSTFSIKLGQPKVKMFSYNETNLTTPKRKTPKNAVAPMVIPAISPPDNDAKK